MENLATTVSTIINTDAASVMEIYEEAVHYLQSFRQDILNLAREYTQKSINPALSIILTNVPEYLETTRQRLLASQAETNKNQLASNIYMALRNTPDYLKSLKKDMFNTVNNSITTGNMSALSDKFNYAINNITNFQQSAFNIVITHNQQLESEADSTADTLKTHSHNENLHANIIRLSRAEIRKQEIIRKLCKIFRGQANCNLLTSTQPRASTLPSDASGDYLFSTIRSTIANPITKPLFNISTTTPNSSAIVQNNSAINEAIDSNLSLIIALILLASSFFIFLIAIQFYRRYQSDYQNIESSDNNPNSPPSIPPRETPEDTPSIEMRTF